MDTQSEEEFENEKFTEEQLEYAIIDLFKQEDYTYVDGETMHRRFKDVLIEEDLESYLLTRYAADNLTNAELQTVINKIDYIQSTPLYEGNRETYWLISEGFDLVREDAQQPAVHIDYLDFEDHDANLFKVVNQYTVVDKKNRRPDVLLFVNGIPLVICEFKTAIEEDKTIHDAWKQITIRYNRDIPKLTKYCCLSVLSDGVNTKMGSIFTPYEYYYSWNKVSDHEKAADGISSLMTMVKGALSKERLIQIVHDFIFYPDDSKKSEAIICRYPQYFGATRMLENISRHLRPAGDGKGGTYFGATGCGKTYMMMFLSRLMTHRKRDVFANPTVIIIVDREDLDSQASELFVTATRYLKEQDVRSLETREDLRTTLRGKESGGVFITTIQKFCEATGLLSDRSNIICISDEAHRSQTGVGEKLKQTDKGLFVTYGFAKYLRDSFPNATYCGVTGTPVDETIAVFGDIVDSYTMKESADDGITVPISYEPRLARVIVSDAETKKINEYYDKCTEEGSNPEQVEDSKRTMSSLAVILRNPDRLKKLAKDLVGHYEALCNGKPEVVQKAMVVCTDRMHAFELLKEILALRPDWGIPHKAEDETKYGKDELDQMVSLPKINLVATQGKDDIAELHDLCGTKEHRKMLDKEFKNDDSNFKIAVVVDMWITGFDVPSLAVMYVDKPLQKHTLVQTISRVNRVFSGKDSGLVVDYIGIKEDMMQAVKKYGGPQENPVSELSITLGIFRNHLAMIDELLVDFDASDFHKSKPLERLMCLNRAAEFVQTSKEMLNRFMGLSRVLKQSYAICYPSGELTDRETAMGQFYMAIRSIIYKQTKGNAPDAAIMNSVVEDMIAKAISCTGVENVIEAQATEDLFSDDFAAKLDAIDLPITKFNALLKLVRRAIGNYGKTNKIKAIEFDQRLKSVVEQYNTRDSLVFTSEVVSDFVNDLSDQLLTIMKDLQGDKASFEKMGITFEEKAFYDILIKVRDDHDFPYDDEKCIELARKIKELVDDTAQYADWSTRGDTKSKLDMNLTVLLYNNGYPPKWSEEVFEKVLAQAENFKENNDVDYDYAVVTA